MPLPAILTNSTMGLGRWIPQPSTWDKITLYLTVPIDYVESWLTMHPYWVPSVAYVVALRKPWPTSNCRERQQLAEAPAVMLWNLSWQLCNIQPPSQEQSVAETVTSLGRSGTSLMANFHSETLWRASMDPKRHPSFSPALGSDLHCGLVASRPPSLFSFTQAFSLIKFFHV